MLEKLLCNSCGAPLEVPDTANFVRCNHCSTQLAVRRRDNVAFTEQIDQLVEKTDELSERLDDLSSHNEVAALDREWEFERENYLIRDKQGHRHVPTEGGSIVGGFAVAGFGAIWTVMAIAITSSAPDFAPFSIAKFVFPLFGLVFIGVGIAGSIASKGKAEQYRRAETRYKRKRSELLRSSRTPPQSD